VCGLAECGNKGDTSLSNPYYGTSSRKAPLTRYYLLLIGKGVLNLEIRMCCGLLATQPIEMITTWIDLRPSGFTSQLSEPV